MNGGAAKEKLTFRGSKANFKLDLVPYPRGYRKNMIRITDILDQASTYLSPTDVALIQKAYVFSAAAHAGQIRLSGEPYLSHPLE